MTNIIPFDYDHYKEFHPKTILFSLMKDVLNDDVIERVYEYLVPSYIDFGRPIQIYYDIRKHDFLEYDLRYVTLKYYDFIFQCARHIWASFIASSEFLFPSYRHESYAFRRLKRDQYMYPLHFEYMKKYRILWMKLFMELACDFRESKSYYNTYFKNLSLNKSIMERKYIAWFINYQA